MTRDEALRLLGFEPGADVDADTLRTAFRRQMLGSHPDLHDGPDAAERTRKLSTAYRLLRSPHPPAPESPAAAQRPRSPADEVRRPKRPWERAGPPVEVRQLGVDSLAIAAPAAEAFMLVLEAADDLGEITYLDRSIGLLEVVVEIVDGPICQIVLNLQGRATGFTEVFATVEAVGGGTAPPAEGVTALLTRAVAHRAGGGE